MKKAAAHRLAQLQRQILEPYSRGQQVTKKLTAHRLAQLRRQILERAAFGETGQKFSAQQLIRSRKEADRMLFMRVLGRDLADLLTLTAQSLEQAGAIIQVRMQRMIEAYISYLPPQSELRSRPPPQTMSELLSRVMRSFGDDESFVICLLRVNDESLATYCNHVLRMNHLTAEAVKKTRQRLWLRPARGKKVHLIEVGGKLRAN